MKGYKMVLLVNAGLFLFTGVLALALAGVLDSNYERCTEDPRAPLADCERASDAAGTARAVTPILLAIGFVLLVLGLVLGRNKAAPPGDY